MPRIARPPCMSRRPGRPTVAIVFALHVLLFASKAAHAETPTGLEDIESLDAENWRPPEADRGPGEPVRVVVAEIPVFGDRRHAFRQTWKTPAAGRYALVATADASFDFFVGRKDVAGALCRGEGDRHSCDLGQLPYGAPIEIVASRYVGSGPARNLRIEVTGPPRPVIARDWHELRDPVFTHARPFSGTGSYLGLQIPVGKIDGRWRGGIGYSLEVGAILGHFFLPVRYRYLALGHYERDQNNPKANDYERTVHAVDVGLGVDTFLGSAKWSLRVDGFVSPQAWWATGHERPEGAREKNALAVGVHTTLSHWRIINYNLRVERILGEDSTGGAASWMASLAVQLGWQLPEPNLPRDF